MCHLTAYIEINESKVFFKKNGLKTREKKTKHTLSISGLSNLEDRITMSAGRCWPLVTFTMSPTATLWTGRSIAEACHRKNREVEERRERESEKGRKQVNRPLIKRRFQIMWQQAQQCSA